MPPRSDAPRNPETLELVSTLKGSLDAVSPLAGASQLSAFDSFGPFTGVLASLADYCGQGSGHGTVYGSVSALDLLRVVGGAVARGWQLADEQLKSGAPQTVATGLAVSVDHLTELPNKLMPGYGALQKLSLHLAELVLSLHQYAPEGEEATVDMTTAKQIAASGLLQSMVSIFTTVTAAFAQYQQKQERKNSQQQQQKGSIKKGFLSAKPKQQQQQQHDQQETNKPESANAAYLYLLANIADDLTYLHLAISNWPGKHLSGKTYAQTVLPAAKLAAAVLQVRGFLSTSSSSSSSSNGLVLSKLDDAVYSIIHTAHIFTLTAGTQLPLPNEPIRNGQLDFSNVITDKVTLQIIESPEFLQMLVLGLCALTAIMYDHQDGKSHLPAGSKIHGYMVDWQQQKQQKQLVPAYHEQCFAALGLASLLPDRMPCRESVMQSPTYAATYLWGVSGVFGHQLHLRYSSSGPSSSSRQQQPMLAPKLCLPLLRVALELLHLTPQEHAVYYGLNIAVQIFNMLAWDQVKLTAAAPTYNAAAAAMTAAAGPAAIRDIEADLVLYLAPVVLHYVRQKAKSGSHASGPAAAAAAAEGPSAETVAAAVVLQPFITLMHDCFLVADSNNALRSTIHGHPDVVSLAHPFKQQPLSTVAALEATMRLLLARAQAAAAAAADGATSYTLQAPQLLTLTDQAIILLKELDPPVEMPAAAAAAAVLQPLPYAFSAMVSAQKCYRKLLSAGTAHTTGCHWALLLGSAQMLPQICAVAQRHMQLLQSTSSNSRMHGSRLGVCGLVPWVVIVGRGLVVLGEQLRDLAALSAEHVDQDSILPIGTTAKLHQVLEVTREGLNMLQKQMDAFDPARCLTAAALGAAGINDLQDQAAAVMRQVTVAKIEFGQHLDSRARCGYGIGLSGLAAVAAMMTSAMPGEVLNEREAVGLMTTAVGDLLPQQLINLGAAVCAALPVPYCCNNPLCVSVTKLSELELMGGKGCVCAGCEVARYCGKECQTAHWKQHKHACKNIIRLR